MRFNKGRPAGQGLIMLMVVLALLFSSITMVWALPKEPVPQNNKIADWKLLSKNNFWMGITNNGSLGQDKGGGNAYGFWPAPTMDANGELSNKMNYIFGWGLWIGAQIKSTKPGKTRDTMCTFGYNPNNGACEFTAGGVIGGVPQAEASSTVKIYSSDGDWELQNSAGNDSVISMMDTRSIYNDYDILQHATGGKPLKVEVIQTTYQWNYPTNQDIIFFLFEVKNTGTDTLFDVYLAPTADCDIGNESGTAANDVCFFDSTTNMAYQYQTSKKETGWSREPGCVGFMFLESPKATKDFTFPDGYKITKDSTIGLVAFKVFNINIDPPGNLEQYKELAGYNYQTGQFARLDPKPASGDQRFMESTGPIDLLPDSTAKTIVAVIGANFNYTKGVHDTIAIADLRTKAKTAQLIYDANWLLPGPPPAPKLSVTAGHKRVIVGWDNTSEIESDPMKNKNLDYWNKVASDSSTISKFDPNFNAYILQGYKLYKSTDGSVYELMAQWDKDDRFIVDSTGVTVVGPEILKAAIRPTGDTLYHTVVLNSNWIATGKDSTFIWKDNSFITDTRGTNSGLQYSFVDENLINGMTYYYSVRAYGVNWQSTLNGAKDSIIDKSPTYYETSIGENATAVVPRSEPSEYVAPQTWVSDYAGSSYNWGQKISITVDLPRAVKKKTYRQEWGPVTRSGDLDTSSIGTAIQYAPVLSYRVIDMDADTVAVPWTKSTMAYDSVRGWDIFLKTVKYTPGNFITLINNILVNSAGFKVNSITPSSNYTDTASAAILTNPDMSWSFRSGTFEIRWTVTGTYPNDTLWPQVWHVVDSVKNIVVQVPYDSMKLNDCLTSSWNLGGTGTRIGRNYMTQDLTAITLPSDPRPSPLLTRQYINICGARVYFNRATVTRAMTWGANKPANGDVWYFRTSGINIPVEGEYQVIKTSEYQFSTSVADLSKITVVPNPYIARNIWERTNDRNKLQFVNLPTKCKIKIYTLAGNLIKVLEHDDNSGRDGGTCWWDPMLTMNQQQIASGVYLYYVDAPGIGTRVGKFAVVR